jgi:hypothetical protein
MPSSTPEQHRTRESAAPTKDQRRWSLPAALEWVLTAGIVATIAAWGVFTFVFPRPAGDTYSTYSLAAGASAALMASAVALAIRARDYEQLLWPILALGYAMLATAIGVGRDKDELEGLGAYVIAVGGSLSLLKFVIDRNEAQRQRRHDRIMVEWSAFVANEKLIPAIRMLEYRSSDLAGLRAHLTLQEYRAWKNPLDQILEFLLRLAHAVDAGELDANAVDEAAGWYFDEVANNEHVEPYCRKQGFVSILNFANRDGRQRRTE